MEARKTIGSVVLLPYTNDRRLEPLPIAADKPLSRLRATGFTHLPPVALHCMTPSVTPASEPGPSLGFRGSRRRFALLSTGCGGIRSHGWTPAFVTNGGRARPDRVNGRTGHTAKRDVCIR